MLVVEMFWGKSNSTIIYGVDQDGELYIKKTISNPNPDPDTRSLDCGFFVWEILLDLGLRYGWSQAGTILIDKEQDPPGNYQPTGDWSRIKMVTAEDAAAWADALEKALVKIEAGEEKLPKREGPIILGKMMTQEEILAANEPTSVRFMREFIAFLKKGPFKFNLDD